MGGGENGKNSGKVLASAWSFLEILIYPKDSRESKLPRTLSGQAGGLSPRHTKAVFKEGLMGQLLEGMAPRGWGMNSENQEGFQDTVLGCPLCLLEPGHRRRWKEQRVENASRRHPRTRPWKDFGVYFIVNGTFWRYCERYSGTLIWFTFLKLLCKSQTQGNENRSKETCKKAGVEFQGDYDLGSAPSSTEATGQIWSLSPWNVTHSNWDGL